MVEKKLAIILGNNVREFLITIDFPLSDHENNGDFKSAVLKVETVTGSSMRFRMDTNWVGYDELVSSGLVVSWVGETCFEIG